MSSVALSHYALGGHAPTMDEYPRDVDDLGRCERAYRAMPATLRARVAGVMRAYRARARCREDQ